MKKRARSASACQTALSPLIKCDPRKSLCETLEGLPWVPRYFQSATITTPTNARRSAYHSRKRPANHQLIARQWLLDPAPSSRNGILHFSPFSPRHFSAFLLVREFSPRVRATFRASKSLRNFLTSAKAPPRRAVYTYKKKKNYDPGRLRTGGWGSGSTITRSLLELTHDGINIRLRGHEFRAFPLGPGRREARRDRSVQNSAVLGESNFRRGSSRSNKRRCVARSGARKSLRSRAAGNSRVFASATLYVRHAGPISRRSKSAFTSRVIPFELRALRARA